MKKLLIFLLVAFCYSVYGQDESDQTLNGIPIKVPKPYYCQLKLITVNLLGEETVTDAFLDLSNQKFHFSRKDLANFPIKDLPTPSFMLNYICENYNLQLFNFQKFISVNTTEYDYVLIPKNN